MTNEEKVKELFNSEIGNLDVPDFDREFEILTALEAMADWKDQQFKEYLENKIRTVNSSNYDSCLELLNEIINELFKKDYNNGTD